MCNELAASSQTRTQLRWALCTTTRVPCPLALPNHCRSQSPRVMCQERVGGRAGTAAPQGAVCELPNPPISIFPLFPLPASNGDPASAQQSTRRGPGAQPLAPATGASHLPRSESLDCAVCIGAWRALPSIAAAGQMMATPLKSAHWQPDRESTLTGSCDRCLL